MKDDRVQIVSISPSAAEADIVAKSQLAKTSGVVDTSQIRDIDGIRATLDSVLARLDVLEVYVNILRQRGVKQ